MDVRQTPRDLNDIRRFISLAAERDRRQEWTVGLNQKSVQRYLLCDSPQLLGFLKGNYSGKGNVKAQRNRLLRQLQTSTETMHDTRKFGTGPV